MFTRPYSILALMYDNLTVAELEIRDGLRYLVLKEEVPDFFVPFDLFGRKRETPFSRIPEWVEDRVPPPNRIGLKKALKEIGLKRYDPMEIAIKTRATLVEDGFWLKVEETDTFEKNSVRGRLGFPKWDEKTYTLIKDNKDHSNNTNPE